MQEVTTALVAVLRYLRWVLSAGTITLVTLLVGHAITGTGGFVSHDGEIAYVRGDEEARRQVARVLAYYADAGFDLPPLLLVTYRDLYWCPGRVQGNARAWWRGGRIDLCLHTDHSLAHELAHLFLYDSTTDDQRTAFAAERGLPTWRDRKWPWPERATEHAANLLVWWVSDRHQDQFVYWRTRGPSPEDDLADLAWLLEQLDPGVFDDASQALTALADPSVDLLTTAGPLPRRLADVPAVHDPGAAVTPR